MKKSNKSGFGAIESFVRAYWPLVFIPVVYGLILPWGFANLPRLGNDFGNIVVGGVVLYLFLFKSDMRQRRLMIMMQVFAFAFETANVASGFYHYVYPQMPYYAAVPMWITLGWAAVGWWCVKSFENFRRIPAWVSYAIVGISLIAVGFAFDYWVPSMIFAVVGIYLAENVVTEIPLGMIAFATVFGLLNEVVGPLCNIWSFTDKVGLNHIPEFGQLSIGYAYVLIFCLWLAGYDKLKD